MNLLREKLSRLFFDPSSSASAASPDSPSSYSSPHPFPDDPHHTQEISNAKESKSFASYFSFIMPMGRSDSSTSRADETDDELYRALHVTRTDENPEWQYFSLDRHVDCTSGRHCCENSMENGGSNECATVDEDVKALHGKIENDDPGSGRSSSGSEMFEEAIDQCSPEKPLDNLLDESTFISPTLYEFLHASLPNIVKGCQWALLYSTLKHGISLRTLIRNSTDLSGPCLLIVGDKQGAVFGGMLQSPLKPTAKRKYQLIEIIENNILGIKSNICLHNLAW